VEIPLKEKPGVKTGNEGRIILLNELYSTPKYSLKNPWLVEYESDSFYIQYASNTYIILELYMDEDSIREVNLPGSESIIRYQVPLSKGDIIGGFRLRTGNPEKENKSFKVLDVGIEKLNSGLSIINNNGLVVTIIPQGFEIFNSNTYLFSDLSEKIDRQFNQVQISFTYNYTGNGDSYQELILFSENQRQSYGINPRNNGETVYFYSKSLEFLPTGLTLINNDPEFSLLNIEINPFSVFPSSDYSPVPADIGTMLNYNKSAWRRSDWELFPWNLFPDILVLDYKDYAIQAASLKRLSFFVEKEGFSGKLINNEVLSGLHGWNAHDYMATDLSAFFSMAEYENFILNSEEYELKSILLHNNIIAKVDNGYDPVSGGILSYSMESSSRLRRLFITHEGYHGIFFSNLEFVTEVQVIWDGLEVLEKQFWYNFLSWKR